MRSAVAPEQSVAPGVQTRVVQTPRVEGRVSSVLDTDAAAGQEQWYRLNGVQSDGRAFTYGPISTIAEGAAFALAPLAPNPSNGHSMISFAVPRTSHVRLSLTDVQGREVALLSDGMREAGRYTAALEATDLQAGVYFVRMQAGGVHLTRRLAVVK